MHASLPCHPYSYGQCSPPILCLLPVDEIFFSILSSSPISPEIYSWGRRLLATNLGRLRALVSFPRTAIAIEMEEAWGPMSECSYRAIKTPEQLCRVEQLSLPEFRKQFLSHTDTGCKCKTFLVPQIDNHYNKRPLPRKDVKYGRRMPKDPSSLAAAQFEVDLPSKGMYVQAAHPAIELY